MFNKILMLSQDIQTGIFSKKLFDYSGYPIQKPFNVFKRKLSPDILF